MLLRLAGQPRRQVIAAKLSEHQRPDDGVGFVQEPDGAKADVGIELQQHRHLAGGERGR